MPVRTILLDISNSGYQKKVLTIKKCVQERGRAQKTAANLGPYSQKRINICMWI
jgi:hypothetical protein